MAYFVSAFRESPTMHILCPHCNCPIELVKLRSGEEISCPSCGSNFSLESESPTSKSADAGKKLGKFELIQAVGHGAFGTVYKARDPELDRVVALKVPHPGSLAAGKDHTRFQREARAAAQLRHPHIVSVHEVGEADGVPFLVSDFVQGVTLTDLLSAGRLGFREAAELAATVADALHYAHEQGVIHRDVKPSNIMVNEDGQPCVMDFGLAKREAGEITMTVEGQVLGTPAFMPPEQARGEGHTVDARGDVYSLGVILYKLLTGELPFRGTARMLVQQVQTEEPRMPRKLNDRIPRDLETITLRAMAKEPGGRYASARDLADDLRRWLKGEPIRARPISKLRRGVRWLRRNPAVASLLVVSALAVAATVGMAVRWMYAGELERALDEAHTQRARAEDVALRGSYRLGFSLALQAFDSGQGGVAVEHLSAIRPETEGATDLRGFEWHHLWRECHRHRAELPGHRDTVRAVAFSPDGKALATAGLDGVLRLWDRATLALRWERPFPAGHALQAVAFSPDGSLLACGGGSETAGGFHLSDAANGQPRGEFSGHAKQVTALTFADGGQLVSGGMDGALKFWDVANRKELASFTLNFNDHPRALALSPDGKTLAVGGVNTILRLWNVADRKERVLRRGMHRGPIWSVAFSPDGKYLATGSYDTRIGVWNPNTGVLMGFVPGHAGPVNGVAFFPKESTLVSVGADQTVRGWSLGDEVTEVFNWRGHSGGVVAVAVSPDGLLVATGGGSRQGGVNSGGEAKLWDAGPDVPREVMAGHGNFVLGLAFSPDGRTLASASVDHTVRLWDVATGRPGKSLEQRNGTIYGLAFAPDGSALLAAGPSNVHGEMRSDGGELTGWDPITWNIRMHLRDAPAVKGKPPARPLDMEVTALAIHPDGRILALGGADDTIRLWDRAAAKEFARLKGHTGSVRALAFSPGGDTLASASSDGTARLWSVADRTTLRTLEGHEGTVWSVQFSPDGATVVTAADRMVRYWDAATGELRTVGRAHTGPVRALTFSPDGRRLASAGADQRVVFWDVQTREPCASLPGRCGGIWAAAFSPDGRALAVGGEERIVRILHASSLKE